jgi:cysteine desulfurase
VIYWDYNATAPLRAAVAHHLASAWSNGAARGNASSTHRAGQLARARLDDAREKVAGLLGCESKEICFTSSGSEANAAAIKGAFFAARSREGKKTLVTSSIEHPSLGATLAQLSREGARIVEIAPEADGRVSADKLISALDGDVALCSLMWANNETGVLQPVAEVADACRERGVPFHTDAVQAVGKVPVSLREVKASLLSLSAHKFGGPTGIGALVIRADTEIEPLLPGHQEGGHRGGTPNVELAEALAIALGESSSALREEAARIKSLRDRFEARLAERLPRIKIHGGRSPRVPNTSSIQFEGVDGEALLMGLDLQGICASSGAACASGSLSPSHVLTAMGVSPKAARSSLRFSIGPSTPEEEMEAVIEALVRAVTSQSL